MYKRVSQVLLLLLLGAFAVSTMGAGCDSKTAADTASDNLAKEAENFKITRKFVVTNGITDKVILQAVGRCSYESSARQLVLTCLEVDKPGEKEDLLKKHTIGLSDNTIWVSVQLEGKNVSVFRTKFIFRPESLIPDVDLVTSGDG